MTDVGVQHPLMTVLPGDGDPNAVENGRRSAALAAVKGYESALTALDPSDVEELTWYRERLIDARVIAGLSSVERLPFASGRPLG